MGAVQGFSEDALPHSLSQHSRPCFGEQWREEYFEQQQSGCIFAVREQDACVLCCQLLRCSLQHQGSQACGTPPHKGALEKQGKPATRLLQVHPRLAALQQGPQAPGPAPSALHRDEDSPTLKKTYQRDVFGDRVPIKQRPKGQ